MIWGLVANMKRYTIVMCAKIEVVIKIRAVI
jgi:hypothetical protein